MNLTFEQFEEIARQHNVIPLFDVLPADLDTPVTAFHKIRSGSYDFLFESVVGGEKWARYSFLGTKPRKIYKISDHKITIQDCQTSQSQISNFKNTPWEILRAEMKPFNVYNDKRLPRFFGGLVGFLGYDMVRYFDKISSRHKTQKQTEESILFLTNTVVIFDNLQQVMKVVSVVFIDDSKSLKALYDEAHKQISEIKLKLCQSIDPALMTESSANDITEQASMTEAEFCQMVMKAKDYIGSGDIFQVVLSLNFRLQAKQVNPFQIYRNIRRINPSPYMYFLDFGDFAIVGASPEVLVRLEDRCIEVRPIAGTRKRGDTEASDLALEHELKHDPKERAEHVMLVDLGRNDIGRVAQIGSVHVDENEVVERYSHVMHLVSHVSGELAADKDVFDVISSTFPAGTLSGAPKIRAMQIIDELENQPREIYGGAVGYISFSGNTDLAITIRTAFIQGNTISVQAGAGIVYNSVPELEYQECCNKARAMIDAIKTK